MTQYDCCYKCMKRHPGCQSEKCPQWAETHSKNEAEKETIRKNKQREAELLAVGAVRGERWRKGAKNKADEKRKRK
ncbi:MAG: hypothetical protein ACI4LK_09120 [Lentihominibacter sp.]